MRRLYLRVWLALIGVILASIMVAALVAWLLGEPKGVPAQIGDALLHLGAEHLPPAGAPRAEQRAAIERLAAELDISVTLLDADGHPLAGGGEVLPAPDPAGESPAWERHHGILARWQRLPDGRWLGMSARHESHGAALHLFVMALGLGALGVGSYKVARRITRRLERLQRGVEAFGAGDLSARAIPEGRDEIAELARAFNDAAARVQTLVEQQKRTLASASHELRSPLARLRMALELLADDDAADAKLVENAWRDIEELDGLIGDLLLASRLESRALAREPINLLDLVAEEAARVDARAGGDAIRVLAEPASLRRLVRNLLENARRYSDDVEARVEGNGEQVRLHVDDRGPGVPAPERERIFAPFYRPPGHREGQGGGVGLGLALVRQIAEAHGGAVKCSDRPGGGSRFTVELPAGDLRVSPHPEPLW